MAKQTWKPWHEVVALRDDLKTGELSLAAFAADLYDVIMQKGQRPTYEDPAEFFALTYPTYNLRELVKNVATRLGGKSDKAYRKLSINYGGGKTHTLITLRHLFHDPDSLPGLAAVQEFTAHVGTTLPKARVAALCFDKIDHEMGVETPGPDGSTRRLKAPWSILAYQLAGSDGLRAINADGEDEERQTPPAEPPLVELLSLPQQHGLATLVLLDEVLMYVRAKAEADPGLRGQLVSFFQSLAQAVVKVDRCAMVASLLASDPRKHDDLGTELLSEVSDVFTRQMEEDASPVGREDVAEVLRRRFFTPESIRDPGAFQAHVTTAVRNVAALDEATSKGRPAAERRYLASFPFHPGLTEVFYSRWTQVDGFQRTRGILRTFAIALRDAEKWDDSPLVGVNVLLSAPGSSELSEAAHELCQVASVEASGESAQQWSPILIGEFDKARAIQSEVAGLAHREVEQAVMAVFLNSQPIGQKALTPELLVLLGATRPDQIELEKALRRWTDLSWFLDEAEVGGGARGADGALPKAWRLGNRPNLNQMHHDACRNRVPPRSVEARIEEAVAKTRSLTDGATAAGAKVHTLPTRPSDINDDGQFRYAVLGLDAVSESGKPSAEAKRFIDQTTAADRPRVFRNAVVLAVPSKDGLEVARLRVREHLGWLEVREQLKGQTIDATREETLTRETADALKRIPDAIRQAYCIVVTVDDGNRVHAFKVSGDGPLFETIKADRKSRIQDTAINSEAMLPGGPYDLWREGEPSRRVKDLVEAFAQFPKLPKMLRTQEILATIVQGVRDGIWVAQLSRPDDSVKSYWRQEIDESALKEAGLEVLLPESATLSELSPELLRPGLLPELWPQDDITFGAMTDYFQGGHIVTVPKDGYDEPLTIPKAAPETVAAAAQQAVEQGHLWLTHGPASILAEPVPAGVLAPTAILQPPPEPAQVQDVTEEAIPDAWTDSQTNAMAISTSLSAKRGKSLPWPYVKRAVQGAIDARWLELVDDDGRWPCEYSLAGNVRLRRPRLAGEPAPKADYQPTRMPAAEATLSVDQVQDLADVIADLSQAAVGLGLQYHLRVSVGGESPPANAKREEINEILGRVSPDLKLT